MALAAGASGQTAIHTAVQNDAYQQVQALISGGASVNALDDKSRTPLTLALELGHKSIAQLLLKSGAQVSFVGRTLSQRADISYMGDMDLAPFFQIALLRDQLLNLAPNDAIHQPDTSIALARNNTINTIPGSWIVGGIRGVCYTGPVSYTGDQVRRLTPAWTPTYPVKAVTTAKDSADGGRVFQFSIGSNPWQAFRFPAGREPVGLCLVGRPVLLEVSGSFTVPKCDFDFASNPTCFPLVSVGNPSFALNSFTNAIYFVGLPPGLDAEDHTSLQVVQGGTTTAIPWGEFRSFDRTGGDLVISAPPFRKQIFSKNFAVRVWAGPGTEVSGSFDLSSRLQTYARIAKIRQDADAIPSDGQSDKTARAKTLASAIHLLSAGAVKSQYLQEVTIRLADVARSLATADLRFRDLTDAIIANDTITPDQFEVTVARIDALLTDASPDARMILERIKSELQAEEARARQNHSAIQILRDHFRTDLDFLIAEYQGLILELAQYTPEADLAHSAGDILGRALGDAAAAKTAIGFRVRARDVIIQNSAVAGRGASLRTAFGLPNP